MHSKITLLFFTLLLSCIWGRLKAQDVHFSMADANPLLLNPALSGMYRPDWRAAVQYRSQWQTVPVQYRTIMANYDTKLIQQKNNMLSVGMLLAQDKAGDAGLSWTQVGVRVSAAHALSQKHTLSVGFSVDAVQRKFDISGLKFFNQWNGDNYDPNLPNKEDTNNASKVRPSVAVGTNWHYEPGTSSRTTIDAGIAMAHLNRPAVHFQNFTPSTLAPRWSLYTFSTLQNTEKIDYIVSAYAQRLKTATEIVLGGGVRYWLSDQTSVKTTLSGRIGDALIPAIQVQQNQWTVGMSYDVNLSGFKVATDRRGGFEIVLLYTPLSVKPIKDLKGCPIF